MSGIRRKPSHCPHCEGSLKGDFASGHLGKSIARDSRLGFLPKNVSEIEQVLVWEFYDGCLDLSETLHCGSILLCIPLHPYFQHAIIVPPTTYEGQAPKAHHPTVAKVLGFGRLESPIFCDMGMSCLGG